jgi:CheY-like chemotaxis protein
MARVLVVDDDKLVALTVSMVLEEAGHTPVVARQGDALLADLEHAPYELVVTDLYMPRLTGWDVARWVQRNRPWTPVVAISGALDGGPDVTMLNAFNTVVPKGRDLENLGPVVSALIRVAPK